MFRLDQDGEVARLTLDRPEARNAIPLGGWSELSVRLDQAERSSARLLVIAGAGGAFCAGADLADFAAFNRDETLRIRFREAMREALRRLRELPIPTLARIEGPCFGAGVALAMACDLRLAGVGARFAITPAKLGISYPHEDVQRLVALVGPGQAARLLFAAATIDGAEAMRIGLVEGRAEEESAIVEAVLANSPQSLATLKRAIGVGRPRDVGQDEAFDSLIAGGELLTRLRALGR